jgi:hypothetical protein
MPAVQLILMYLRKCHRTDKIDTHTQGSIGFLSLFFSFHFSPLRFSFRIRFQCKREKHEYKTELSSIEYLSFSPSIEYVTSEAISCKTDCLPFFIKSMKQSIIAALPTFYLFSYKLFLCRLSRHPAEPPDMLRMDFQVASIKPRLILFRFGCFLHYFPPPHIASQINKFQEKINSIYDDSKYTNSLSDVSL